jgi:hypothetical protein
MGWGKRLDRESVRVEDGKGKERKISCSKWKYCA